MINRRLSLMPNGIPRYVRCYENTNVGAQDRYTVIFTGRSGKMREKGGPSHHYQIGLSGPSFSLNQPADTKRADESGIFMPPKMGHRGILGKRIAFLCLPMGLRRSTIQTYKKIWKL